MELPIVPHVSVQHEQPPPPAPDARVPEALVPAPTAEQVETADRVFVSDDAEKVAGLMGMYGGMMLLRDLAREHLRRDEEEEEEDLRDEEKDPTAPPR